MLYILIIAGIVLAEHKIKKNVERNLQLGDKKEILQGKIILKKQYNRGMFLNFMEDKVDLVKKTSTVLLGILLIIFTFLLPRQHNKLLKLGLSLCLGGAISNVSDRMKRGYVVDYFSFNCKKLKNIIFNLADIFILLGSFLMLLSSVFSPKGKGSADKTAE
jgi:signal peptidase II